MASLSTSTVPSPYFLPQPTVADLRISNSMHENSYWVPLETGSLHLENKLLPSTNSSKKIITNNDEHIISSSSSKQRKILAFSIMIISFFVGILMSFYVLGTNIYTALISLLILLITILLIVFILTLKSSSYLQKMNPQSIASYAQKIVSPAKHFIKLLNI